MKSSHLTKAVMLVTKAVVLVAMITAADGAWAEDWNGCADSALDRRITACTRLIETPGIDGAHLAEALVRRGYAYIELGQLQHALRDYDEAIRIAPRFAPAFINRAVIYQRLDQPSRGLPDAEMAVQLAPREPHSYYIRGQVKLLLGDKPGAMQDHDAAISLGGARWVKFYQCGLRLAQFYHGPVDGILRPELGAALRVCMDSARTCDPVPAKDPECPDPVG